MKTLSIQNSKDWRTITSILFPSLFLSALYLWPINHQNKYHHCHRSVQCRKLVWHRRIRPFHRTTGASNDYVCEWMLERPKRRLSVSGTGSGELERDHGHHAVIESTRQTFELSGWAPHQHQIPSENRPHHQREMLLHHLSYLRRRMYCRGHSHTLECQKRPALTARHNFSIKMHSASSAIPPAISRGSDAAEELSTQEYLKTKRKLAA